VLKELQSKLSINDEVQKLFSDDASSVPISQQRRLERKISNNLLLLFIHLFNLMVIIVNFIFI